jgi:hypothetical protein
LGSAAARISGLTAELDYEVSQIAKERSELAESAKGFLPFGQLLSDHEPSK